MDTNRCPVCAGFGRVLAFGVCTEPVPVPCPECAGLAIVPASADDVAIRTYTAAEVTELLLRHPALPAAADGAGLSECWPEAPAG